jgi:hypothetical protein
MVQRRAEHIQVFSLQYYLSFRPREGLFQFFREPAMQATLLPRNEPAVDVFLSEHVMELEAIQAELPNAEHSLILDEVMLLPQIAGERLHGCRPFEPEDLGNDFGGEPFSFHTGHVQQIPLQRIQSRQPLLDDRLHPGWRWRRRERSVFHPVTTGIQRDVLVVTHAVDQLDCK